MLAIVRAMRTVSEGDLIDDEDDLIDDEDGDYGDLVEGG